MSTTTLSSTRLRALVDKALHESATDARRIAYQTNTPLVIVKDGKIVRAKVTKSLELKFPKVK